MYFAKTQKSRFVESETLLYFQIKKSLITHEGLLIAQNNFVPGLTLKEDMNQSFEMP